jgi:hypothetical protein
VQNIIEDLNGASHQREELGDCEALGAVWRVDGDRLAGARASLDNSTNKATPPPVKQKELTGRKEELSRPPLGSLGSHKSLGVDAWESAWLHSSWGVDGARCGGETAEKDEEGGVRVVPMLCGQWSCVVCGRLKYRWFVRNVKNASKEHGLKYFWTLTIAHGDCSPAASWELISVAWNRFRNAMAREGHRLTYVWVVEPQKSGHAHLHVLWDRWVDHADVSRLWERASGGSKIVWVERVKDDKAAVYLAKYCSKLAFRVLEVPGMGELVGRHRFAKSRNITFSPFRHKAEGWVRAEQSFKAALGFFGKLGLVLAVDASGVPSFLYGGRGPGPYRFEVGSHPVGLLDGQLGRSPPADGRGSAAS